MTKRLRKVDITSLLIEYAEDNTIFNEEAPIVKRLKHIIFNDLDETERRIILLYADVESQREVAKALNVSASTVNIIINRIRRKIYDLLGYTTDSGDNGADS